MGGVIAKGDSSKASLPETKLEAKIIEAMQRREVQGECLETLILVDKNRFVFLIDEDGNGTIDRQEMKRCFQKLEIKFSDEEISDLFEACDINDGMGMRFNEFIVLLCLVYLLKVDPTPQQSNSCMGMPDLKVTFETLVDAFVFLDKNKDGYVSKNEMVDAINETNSGERSSGRIAMKRFEEMDWDKNGMVNFKEFLFAFTHWVGIEDIEDDEGKSNV